MDSIIKRLEEKLLDQKDVFRIADKKWSPDKFITHTELARAGDLGQLMEQRGNFLVVLWESRADYGHWTCLIRHTKPSVYYEFFDSFGLPPDGQLAYMHYGQTKPFLSAMLDDTGLPWIYNHVKLQKEYHHVNTCGRYVGLRLLLSDRRLSDYVLLLTKNKHYDPDFWVSAITMIT